MAKRYPAITAEHTAFITQQKLFFVATAGAEGRINLSPKGMDSLRVLSGRRVVWLNATGSGNETAAHLLRHPRMTIMFCAFAGPPLILRLYGTARAIHPDMPEWDGLSALFTPLPGARQIFDVEVDLVQSSCGTAVPCFTYEQDRDMLRAWATAKGEAGIREYWAERNSVSLDGLPTRIDQPVPGETGGNDHPPQHGSHAP